MKKVFLLACMLFSTLLTFAQIKKVAILEVVDREGRLSYSQKLVLRSNMARAIANTNGYEAYDRSDVDVIMSEQNFQRTGVVSEREIRKLGEMTGVSLILVTEGVLLDANKIFVTAKILNVETGRVDMTDNISMGLESGAMQQGCNTLASKLFGISAVASQASKYYVTSLSDNYYSYRGQTLDEKAYMNFLRNNCPEAFAQHRKGRVMTISGWVAFSAGLAMTAIGAGLIVVGNNNAQSYNDQIADIEADIAQLDNMMENKYGSKETHYKGWRNCYEYYSQYYSYTYSDECAEMLAALNQIDSWNALISSIQKQRDTDPAVAGFKNPGIALAVVGPIAVGGSIPLLYFGYKTKKKSTQIYNDNCASSTAKPLSLNLTSGYNGIGLAVLF